MEKGITDVLKLIEDLNQQEQTKELIEALEIIVADIMKIWYIIKHHIPQEDVEKMLQEQKLKLNR